MSRLAGAAAMARDIREGRVSSEQLVRACLERIGARESAVGAWQWLSPEQALAAAREADRKPSGGLLHGVPIGVKDIMDTADMPTGHGFARYAQVRPAWDASCVALCRQAGAIVLGKTVTTEFAYFAPGKTRNPRNLAATPGGSSSGSAAAVADGMAPLALGSQTAASVIRPAAFCGVVGYKASLGEFSLAGIRPFSESFDSLGVLANYVEDIVLMRAVLHRQGRPPAPAASARAKRLGFCRTPQWACVDEPARREIERFVQGLAKVGIAVEEAASPGIFGELAETHNLADARARGQARWRLRGGAYPGRFHHRQADEGTGHFQQGVRGGKLGWRRLHQAGRQGR